jgi:vitamin B12/bleomycin/antimicrobial peptide transport system ATP-binding/permease protein
LDEATSALDAKNEQQLYALLQASGMTYLSVGHRESLSNYHRSVLDFTSDRTWSLSAADPQSMVAVDLTEQDLKVA